MLVARVEYRVKKDFAERNRANILAFLPELRQRLRAGSRYDVAVSEDGCSFLHLFFHTAQDEEKMLGEISEFRAFLDGVMAGGCEAPPSISHYSEI